MRFHHSGRSNLKVVLSRPLLGSSFTRWDSGRLRNSKLSQTLCGFTLVELLVVITVIVIMASLMGPMLSSALRGTNMTQGADKVIGMLSLAHQTAVTKNQTVAVRF